MPKSSHRSSLTYISPEYQHKLDSQRRRKEQNLAQRQDKGKGAVKSSDNQQTASSVGATYLNARVTSTTHQQSQVPAESSPTMAQNRQQRARTSDYRLGGVLVRGPPSYCHQGFPKSPFLENIDPVVHYAEHWHAKLQFEGAKARREAQYSEQGWGVKTPAFCPKSAPNRGTVLSEHSVWTPKCLENVDLQPKDPLTMTGTNRSGVVSPWPQFEEMRYEGDDRVSSNLIHFRFAPLPRTVGNATVNWQKLSNIEPFPFDDLECVKKPTDESIHAGELEVGLEDEEYQTSEDKGRALIGDALMEAINPRDVYDVHDEFKDPSYVAKPADPDRFLC